MNVQKKKLLIKNIYLLKVLKNMEKTIKNMKKFLTFVKKEKKGKDNNNKIEVKVELIKEEELLLKELATGLYNSFKDECIFMV